MPKNTTGKWSVPPEIRAMKPVGTLVKRGHDDQHYYVYEHANYKGEDGKWHTRNGRLIGYIQPGVGFIPRASSEGEAEEASIEEALAEEASVEEALVEEAPIEEGETEEIEGTEEGKEEAFGERESLEPFCKSPSLPPPPVSASLTILEYGPYALAQVCTVGVLSRLRECFSPEEAQLLYLLGILLSVNDFPSPPLLFPLYLQSCLALTNPKLQLEEGELFRQLSVIGEKEEGRRSYQALELSEGSPLLLTELSRREWAQEGEMASEPLPFYTLSLTLKDGDTNRPLAREEISQGLLGEGDLQSLIDRYSLKGRIFWISQGRYFPFPGEKISIEGQGEREGLSYLLALLPGMEGYEEAIKHLKDWDQRFLFRRAGHRSVVEYKTLPWGKGERILMFRDIDRNLLEAERYEALAEKGVRGYSRKELERIRDQFGLWVVGAHGVEGSPREIFELLSRALSEEQAEGMRESLAWQNFPLQEGSGMEALGEYWKEPGWQEGYAFALLLARQMRFDLEKSFPGEELKQVLARARMAKLYFHGEGLWRVDEGLDHEYRQWLEAVGIPLRL